MKLLVALALIAGGGNAWATKSCFKPITGVGSLTTLKEKFKGSYGGTVEIFHAPSLSMFPVSFDPLSSSQMEGLKVRIENNKVLDHEGRALDSLQSASLFTQRRVPFVVDASGGMFVLSIEALRSMPSLKLGLPSMTGVRGVQGVGEMTISHGSVIDVVVGDALYENINATATITSLKNLGLSLDGVPVYLRK